MRILFFSKTFGLTTFIGRQVEEVAKVHEVLYICINKADLYSPSLVPVKQLPFKYPKLISKMVNRFEKLGLIFFRKNQRFKRALHNVIRDYNPDIIHCQFGYEALILTENLGAVEVPLLIHFRGYDASRMLRYPVYVKKLRTLLGKPHVYAAFVCNHLKENLEKAGIKVERYKIIYSNTDVQHFRRGQGMSAKPKKLLLQVSTLREKKGHEFTLRAIQILIEQFNFHDFKLVLTGFDPNNPRSAFLQKMILDMGLVGFVEVLGHVDPMQVKELLEKADAFLLHSIKPQDGDEEGIPNALMEAMAMELPVVSTWHSGIPELVDDGVNGILVPERDVYKYAQAIKSILTWPLMPVNREKVVNKFSKHTHMKDLLDYYHQIAREKEARGTAVWVEQQEGVKPHA